MEPNNATRVSQILSRQESAVLQEWMNELLGGRQLRKELISESTLREQAREFLSAFGQAAQQGAFEEIEAPSWSRTREVLGDIASSHAKAGTTSVRHAR